MSEYRTLYMELAELKKENKELKAANEVMQKIIDSYYQQDKHDLNKFLEREKKYGELSDGAKQFVKDIVEGKIWVYYNYLNYY